MMNPLVFLTVVAAFAPATPTAVVRKNAFSGVEIVYRNLDHQRYVKFQIEAFIGNRWALIDDDVNCKELRASNIISCGPTPVRPVNMLSFALKDCEYIYRYPYESYDRLFVRLKTLTYHFTKTSHTVSQPRYFAPFWIKK